MEERIQKIMAAAGISSRRAAEEIILEGRVRVNGQVVTELGAKADPEKDHIKVDGKLINPQQPKTYLMLNKPAGCVTTMLDPEGRPTVTELLKGVKVRVYPVGRLDYDTEGLLLLTNDGDFAFQVTHPRHELPKTYLVKVKGVLEDGQIERLEQGVFLKDGKTAPAIVRKVRKEEANSWIEVTIHEGRKRQVRRMIDHTGHSVIKLKRVKVGALTLGDLPLGAFRYLSPDEVASLKDLAQGGASVQAKPSRRPAAAGHVPEFIEGPKAGLRPKKKPGQRPERRAFATEEPRPGRTPWRSEKREGREGRYGGERQERGERRFDRPSVGAKRPFVQRDARGDKPFGGKRAEAPVGERPRYKQRDERPRERSEFRSSERRPGKPSYGSERPFGQRYERKGGTFGGKRAETRAGERPQFKRRDDQPRERKDFRGVERRPVRSSFAGDRPFGRPDARGGGPFDRKGAAGRTAERPQFKRRDDRQQERTGYRKDERRSGKPFFGGDRAAARQGERSGGREQYGKRPFHQRDSDRRPGTGAAKRPAGRGAWQRDDRSRGMSAFGGARKPRGDRERTGSAPSDRPRTRTGSGPRPAGRPFGKPKGPGKRRP